MLRSLPGYQALRAQPALRRAVTTVVPAKRRRESQWRRINRAFADVHTVQSGAFAGTRLSGGFTGSHVPKRLGCYEEELQPLITAMSPYDVVLDVGCGEGWYVIGLARLWPDAEVVGFDISEQARQECTANAALNSVRVRVEGAATPSVLAGMVRGRTLVLVDAEGAEVDVLDPVAGPGLRRADLLVEMHDFLRPGATEAVMSRFPERTPQFIQQAPRSVDHPALRTLAGEDRRRAVDESRSPSQHWLWLPVPSETTVSD